MESEMNEMFNLMPGTNAERASMKSAADKYKAVRQLRIDCKGLDLIIEEFGKEFKEWNLEQYKSLDNRQIYLKAKEEEMEELSTRFKTDVKEKLTAARIRIARWNEDEVWSENDGEGGGEVEVEAEAGGGNEGE